VIVFATFIAAGALAWAHFELVGRVILPGLTVWVAWYAAALFALIMAAWRSGSVEMRFGAAVMAASFCASHLIWQASLMPIPAQCLKNIAVSGVLVSGAVILFSRSLIIAAGLHLVIVVIGAAVDLGFLMQGKRPMQFIALSFPDVSAGIQHAALISIGAGRYFERESSALGGYSGFGRFSSASGLASMADVQAGAPRDPTN